MRRPVRYGRLILCLFLIPSLLFPPVNVTAGETEGRPNRLINEKSPYLLQHARNPVDWYPWGDEAFRKAKEEQKPIFLSIGYSTCHWCHVMEKESFENEAIAALMNESFVSIKLDREERPDIDKIYMSYVQATTGSGGWPMTVFLTPDRIPYYGGTYFPPDDKWGRPGMRTLLKSMADTWQNRRDEILKTSERVVQFLEPAGGRSSGDMPDAETLKTAFEHLQSSFDSVQGGFGQAPKFPTSHRLSLLMRYHKRTQSMPALSMVRKTLDAMAAGGMYDQLGGGFHRYSVDGLWRVPHFEKMLYDQAILLRTYAEAYQLTRQEPYARLAREIADYVIRDMQSEEGGFYSALDADSLPPEDPAGEKVEGAFYMWRAAEIETILGTEDAAIFNYVYGVHPNGNTLNDPHGDFVDKNVLYRAHTAEEAAARFKGSAADIGKTLARGRGMLLAKRNERPHPHLDDKVLTDWNGLMIGALAYASRVLGEPRYSEAAVRAGDFVREHLTREGRLLHRYRDGEAGIAAQLDDYAFWVYGLLHLYEVSWDESRLEEAVRLTDEMIELFSDKEHGGFYMTAGDAGEFLITRPKDWYDGAMPSGNSVALLDLYMLSRITGEARYSDLADRSIQSISNDLSHNPTAYTQALMGLDYALGPSYEIVLAGDPDSDLTQDMLHEIDSRFIPNRVMMLHRNGKSAERMEKIAPFIRNQNQLEGKTTAYVCQNHVCRLPSTDLEALKKELP